MTVASIFFLRKTLEWRDNCVTFVVQRTMRTCPLIATLCGLMLCAVVTVQESPADGCVD